MKGLWTLFDSPSTPWARFLWSKHYRLRPPLLPLKVPTGSSLVWKDMLRLAAPFNTSVGFALGNGRSLPFWTARWFGDFSLSSRFPNLHAASVSKHVSTSTWLHRYASSPSAAFLSPLSSQDLEEFLRLNDLASSWEITNSPDTIYWRWHISSHFSFLIDSGVKDDLFSFVWKSKVPLRVKLFLWLAAKNRILTADNLAKRGWIGPSICVLCGDNQENLHHLLLDCRYTKALWDGLLHRQTACPGPLHSITGYFISRWRLLRSSMSGHQRDSFDTGFAATCWEIWKERNARLFNNCVLSAAIFEDRVLATTNAWATALGA